MTPPLLLAGGWMSVPWSTAAGRARPSGDRNPAPMPGADEGQDPQELQPDGTVFNRNVLASDDLGGRPDQHTSASQVAAYGSARPSTRIATQRRCGIDRPDAPDSGQGEKRIGCADLCVPRREITRQPGKDRAVPARPPADAEQSPPGPISVARGAGTATENCHPRLCRATAPGTRVWSVEVWRRDPAHA